MRIINSEAHIINSMGTDIEVLKNIEYAGRTCYKSENKITEDSAKIFVKMLLNRGHESPLEHSAITVKFICDRGISHEIVRHRLASYCQESTRYCNYSKDGFNNEITVIAPSELQPNTIEYDIWEKTCEATEAAYFRLLELGCTPQNARSVLPNSLKTELIMTANVREWRKFFELRTSVAAHPDMRKIARNLQEEFREHFPILFDTLWEKEEG